MGISWRADILNVLRQADSPEEALSNEDVASLLLEKGLDHGRDRQELRKPVRDTLYHLRKAGKVLRFKDKNNIYFNYLPRDAGSPVSQRKGKVSSPRSGNSDTLTTTILRIFEEEKRIDSEDEALSTSQVVDLIFAKDPDQDEDRASLGARVRSSLSNLRSQKRILHVREGNVFYNYLPAHGKGKSVLPEKPREEKNAQENEERWARLEKDLYPLLPYYFGVHQDKDMKKNEKYCFGGKVHIQTFEEQGGGSGGRGQYFPDAVGVQFVGEVDGKISQDTESDQDSLKLLEAEVLGEDRFKIYSFEVKPDITKGRLRKDYLQAVGNSSWAHEGYLVAAKVYESAKEDDEVNMLNALYGIGIAEIKEDGSTDIIIEAKPKDRIPREVWGTMMNHFAERQSFEDFIDGIYNTLRIGNVRRFYRAIHANQKEIKNLKGDIAEIHRRVIAGR
ncbi:MAG: hypothetical protein OXB93_07070 [Cytophagales bacterium]|nr:hypothetical protein [Cytophagales bacterium]